MPSAVLPFVKGVNRIVCTLRVREKVRRKAKKNEPQEKVENDILAAEFAYLSELMKKNEVSFL